MSRLACAGMSAILASPGLVSFGIPIIISPVLFFPCGSSRDVIALPCTDAKAPFFSYFEMLIVSSTLATAMPTGLPLSDATNTPRSGRARSVRRYSRYCDSDSSSGLRVSEYFASSSFESSFSSLRISKSSSPASVIFTPRAR